MSKIQAAACDFGFMDYSPRDISLGKYKKASRYLNVDEVYH